MRNVHAIVEKNINIVAEKICSNGLYFRNLNISRIYFCFFEFCYIIPYGEYDMPDVTLRPLVNKKLALINKKSIIVWLLILTFLVVAIYRGYEWYENKQFINSAIPIYKSSVTLAKDIDRVEKDDISIDSKEEIKETGNSIKLLKLRAVELPIKTKYSSNIQDNLILMLEIQLDRIYYLIALHDNTIEIHNVETKMSQTPLYNEKEKLKELLTKNDFLKQKYVESTKSYGEMCIQLSNMIIP